MVYDPFLALLRDFKSRGIDFGSVSISNIREKFCDPKYTLLSAIYNDWSAPDCRRLLRRLIETCPIAVADLGLIPFASVEERYPVIVNAPILTLFRAAKYLTKEEIYAIYDFAMSRQYHTSERIIDLLAVKVLCRLAPRCYMSGGSFIRQTEEYATRRLHDLCACHNLKAVDYDFDSYNIVVLPADENSRSSINGNIVTNLAFDGCVTPAIWPLVNRTYISEVSLLSYYSQFGHGIPPTFNESALNEAISYFLTAGDVRRALCTFLASPCKTTRENIIQLGQQLAERKELLAPDYYAAYNNLSKQLVDHDEIAAFSDGLDSKFAISACNEAFRQITG